MCCCCCLLSYRSQRAHVVHLRSFNNDDTAVYTSICKNILTVPHQEPQSYVGSPGSSVGVAGTWIFHAWSFRRLTAPGTLSGGQVYVGGGGRDGGASLAFGQDTWSANLGWLAGDLGIGGGGQWTTTPMPHIGTFRPGEKVAEPVNDRKSGGLCVRTAGLGIPCVWCIWFF